MAGATEQPSPGERDELALAAASLGSKSRHGMDLRFGFFYFALGAVLAGAIAGAVLIALQPGKPKPTPWASWQPPAGSSAKVADEVASHVAKEYRLQGSGQQLVAVLAGTPEVAKGAKTTSVSTIAIRSSASAECCSRILSSSGAVQDELCGLGSDCSIATGTASATRERLLRREALEIALYTFKFAPAVKSVIAFLPPPPGQVPSTLLFLERSNFSRQLSQPLARTLPLATPPTSTSLDSPESATIDRLTLPGEYSFQYEGLNDGTEAIILTPGAT
jgi:hypothetical protein